MSESTPVVPASPPEPLYTFAKNSRERVQASLTTFKSRPYIDVRVYFQADDDSWRPTKKGITIDADLLDELEAAVRALREAVGGDLEQLRRDATAREQRAAGLAGA